VQARQITYFLAVVEHGGFGRAAAALRVAQPTLSQSIKSLERDLGADLFHRASDGVVLSAAGRALLGPARQLVRDLGSARESVGTTTATRALDLIAAAPLGTYPGAALVASFRLARPDVRVRMDRPDSDGDLPVAVREGGHELGLTYLPVPRLGLTEVELGRHELMLACPADQDPAPGADTVPLRQLDGSGLIATPRGSWQRDLVEAALRGAGARTRLVLETGQRDTILELVRAGVGAAFVVDAAAPAARALGVVVRPVDPPIVRPYGLVHLPRPLAEPAQAFVSYAVAQAGVTPTLPTRLGAW
jgi:DNA-binding transcriptional LysR family regulator